LLERASIINAIPTAALYSEISTGGFDVTVLFDDSLSMREFYERKSVFMESMDILQVSLRQAKPFSGYMLSDPSSPIDAPSDFFDGLGQFSSSDTSELSGALKRVLAESESSGSEDLFVMISDLCTTETNNGEPNLKSLAEVISGNYLQSRFRNVAVITMHASYVGNLYSMPSMSADSSHRITGLGETVHSKYVVDGRANAVRPVYMIIMGGEESVSKLARDVYAQLNKPEHEGLLDLYVFDEFPKSPVLLPVAQPLSDSSRIVQFSGDFENYAKPLPEIEGEGFAVDFIYTESLARTASGEPSMFELNDMISENAFPARRVLSDKATSDWVDVELVLEQPDVSVTVDPHKVSVRTFVAEYVKSEVDVRGQSPLPNNQKKVTVEKKDVEYVTVKNVTRSGSKLNITVRVRQVLLELNCPAFFFIELPLDKEIIAGNYAELTSDERERRNEKWRKVDLDLQEYWNQAYINTAIDWTTGKRKVNENGNKVADKWVQHLDGNWLGKPYTLTDSTLGFSEFMRELAKSREDYILANNVNRISSDVKQFVGFALVIRQHYAKDYSLNRVRNSGIDRADNGGYAFSTDEWNAILHPTPDVSKPPERSDNTKEDPGK
jgi:hypothetical protein